MAAKIFRINYKSDFILTLTSDAGWMTPFCIKFWTGAPSMAYYAGWDGETYTHCAYDPNEPTKLVVQFDDHHLPVGDLKFQIGYHFTVADFPNDTEDEVINPANITVEIDGETYQVMLDFTGETAPEIEFALPAYANEQQRIENEQQREQKFAQMRQDFENMQQDSETATEGAEKVNAQLNGTTLTVTNREGVSTSSDVQGPQGEPGEVTKAELEAVAATKADKTVVDAIQALIPGQASAQNQLADKNFVNSTVGTNTANYISNNGQPFASVAELEAYSGTLTNNDYAFVVGTDGAGNTTYTRYKYNAKTQTWAAEYVLNNSSFTAAQWATIQSGITAVLTEKLNALPTNASLTQTLDAIKALIPNDVSRTATGATFVNVVNGTITALFYLRAASASLAGLLTAAMFNKLDALPTSQELTERFSAKQDKLPLRAGEGDNSIESYGGTPNFARGEMALAIGQGNTAAGMLAMLLGKDNSGYGYLNVLLGMANFANKDYACCLGFRNDAQGWGSVCTGMGLKTTNEGEGAVGRWNTSTTGQIFSVGCGTSDNDRKNAIVVDMDGKVSFPQENTSVTGLVAQTKKIPTAVSRTATDATFDHVENGTQTPLFNLRQATTSLAGLMTAADKTKLDNLSQEIEGLKQRIAALEGNA